eukprot:CAMPEP_0113263844 /NCGR_PEP_ID=MMETSP0008_2-20120614/18666_1 /TAXON_ID=97485 /ORGANISM="Prymnesium parvum" /LENGTH=54 /DNA_ID=CAMNT_0000112585 /DNA_START=499 /DNA_END=660 /DNA_ORIENTATION=+ /assembly_acc=CAM_ASM_000153
MNGRAREANGGRETMPTGRHHDSRCRVSPDRAQRAVGKRGASRSEHSRAQAELQ